MKAVAVLLAVSLAALAQGRSLVEVDVVDVRVDGHSATQLNATRYDVHQAQVAAEDVLAPNVVIGDLGTVKGTVSYTEQGKRPIYQYLGIPFAEAPVGERRFVAPVPKAPWEGVRDASAPGKMCIQTDATALLTKRRRREASLEAAENQSEDCLVLDVHTPKVDPSAKLPVLVFVHGGSFLTGSAGIKTPQGLLDDDLILVSPQYRLGALGFLNLQTDEVPGNAGLMDIVEALRWVNKYISFFGGDPTRVTLGGHSAGAASASVLYLSPLTEGLIHGVLPMSGSALGFWAYDREPEVASNKIAVAAQCLRATMEERVQCLRQIPAQALVQGSILVSVTTLIGGSLGMSGTIPSVQRASGTVKVLPDWPENILSSNTFKALPYLTGVTKHEGTFPLEIAETGYLAPNKLQGNTSFVRNDLIHVLLKVIGNDDPAGFVADSVLQAFTDLNTLGDYTAMRDGLVDLAGAFGFKSPARRIVERNSDLGQPSFLYAFNYNGIVSKNSREGIYHGADQPYLFPDGTRFEGDDLNVATTLRKLVANFVIYQNPTPAGSPVVVADKSTMWPAYERDSERYLELVWPPSRRQWFRTEMTVARRDQFNEGGRSTSTSSSSSSTTVTTSTRSKAGDEVNAAPLTAPTALLILTVVLAAAWRA